MRNPTNSEIDEALDKSLMSLLAAARLSGPEMMELLARRMITVGGAGYSEVLGNRKTAEAFYRMADQLAVEPEEARR